MSGGVSSDSTDTPETIRVSDAAQSGLPDSSAVGTAVSRYVVLEHVGRGGMGNVRRAYDPKLHREVALKELRPDVLNEEASARLVAEARAMAKLSHPNVVSVFDVEILESGRVVLVMEFVEGLTLRAWLRRDDPDWQTIVDHFTQAGRGLTAAHEAGLLHRDFKPQNVLVSNDATVKVTDFGIAKSADSPSASESLDAAALDEVLTTAGSVVGTPRYMAPEQHRGVPLSPAADQYAFCVALWEALCGAPPFSGETMAADKAKGPPPWPNKRVPDEIVRPILRGLAPDPNARWPTMTALLQALAWSPVDRRTRLLVGAVGLAAAGLAYRAWTVGSDTQCAGAEEHLVGVWDEDRRAEVRAAFFAIDKPYAEQAWIRAERALDDYADAWANMHTEACEATTVRGEQSPQMLDLRMGCLQRASVKLRSAVDVLSEADAALVSRAEDVTGGLRPLAGCADVDALTADVEPPTDEEAEAVARVRTELSRAEALRDAGRYQEAKRVLMAAREGLAEVEYGPVMTEAAMVEANILEALGQYDAAEASLDEAVRLAAQWGQRDTLREAALQLMYVVGAQLERYDDSMSYRALLEGLSATDPLAEAQFRDVLASILGVHGNASEAEAQRRIALEKLAAVRGPEHADTAVIRDNLATDLYAQGKYGEAEAESRAALALTEAALGSDHPDAAASRNKLGDVLRAQGKYVEAEAEHRAALTLRLSALGPEHLAVAESRNDLAAALFYQGKHTEAEAEMRVALALREAGLGSEHPSSLASRQNLAGMLGIQGKHAEAEAELREVVRLLVAAHGPNSPDAANARNNLANELGAQGKNAEAEAEHRKALAAFQVLDPDHPDVAMSRHNLADLMLELGRTEEALEFAEAAWERRQKDDTPIEHRADAAFTLARSLWSVEGARRDRIRAQTLAKEALDIYRQMGEVDVKYADRVERWLAERNL